MPETKPCLDDLVDFFQEPDARGISIEMREFVEMRLGETKVGDIPGVRIGAVEKLAEKNIFKAWQLQGFVLSSDKGETLSFLKECGVAPGQAKKVAYALLLNYRGAALNESREESDQRVHDSRMQGYGHNHDKRLSIPRIEWSGQI